MTDGNIHVLHVDDDPSITELATTMLERETDIRVTTANDPESVPEIFERGAYDCIVSDYDMPQVDGLELFDRLKPVFGADDFPYILFTGRGSEEVAAEALNSGVTGYLQKGGSEQYERLANRIRNATKQYRAQRRADRYETVIEALGYPVYVVDESGRFRFVNEPFAALTGYDRETILGEQTGFVKPDDTVEHAEDELGRLLSSSGPDVARFEATIETADGEHVRCRDHMGVLPYEGERFRGSVGILRVLDTATDGGRSADSQPSLFETLPEPTLLATVEGGEPRIRRVNSAFERAFGVDAAAEAPLSEFVDPGAAGGAIEEAHTGGEPVSLELRRERADGETRDFLFRAVPTEGGRVYGIYTDITERLAHESNLTAVHRAAQELMAAESVEAVGEIGVEAAGDILGHELASLHRYDEREAALVPTAWTETELLNRPPTFERGEGIAWRVFESGDAVVSDDVRADPDVFDPETAFRSEMLFPLGDHGVLLVASSAVGAFTERDVSLGRTLAATVQSALGQVERQRQRREREASLARQNERLDEFAAIVSHDLRTPLDLAGVHLELAAEGRNPEEHMTKVSDAHDRMADLIGDVLTWAREGDAVDSTERVSLPRLFEECWTDHPTDEATLRVDTEWTVEADRGRLKRVFDNLLDNALAYAGETVTITVGDLEDAAGVYVADDGPGIPEAEREAVFDSGHALSTEGTGFGLAIVRQIVEAHGWEITLTESESGGTRFEIRF
jgi:PAS domain S-box-containing protein